MQMIDVNRGMGSYPPMGTPPQGPFLIGGEREYKRGLTCDSPNIMDRAEKRKQMFLIFYANFFSAL